MHKDYLINNSEATQKLKNLLRSKNTDNIELAFQLLKGGGVPVELYTDMTNSEEKILFCLKYQIFTPLGTIKTLTLRAYERPISHLLKDIHRLSNLEHLDLDRGCLSNLSEAIGKLAKLRIFCCRENQLTELPHELTELKNLRRLYLEKNHLRALPEQIGNLQKLEYLALTCNQIQYFPNSIRELKKLRKLFIWENPLSRVEIEKIKKMLPHTQIYIR